MRYSVVQISGRQYLVEPGKEVEVDRLEANQPLLVDKVLLLVDEGKVEVGRPYLNTVLNFEVLGNIQKPKIRVAKYKAKANYRKVIGQKREVTKVKWVEMVDIKKDSKSVKNKA